MADITKQSYEEFRVDVDFGLNMEAGETLVLPDSSASEACDIKCWDKDGTDVTDTLLDIDTMTTITGSESALPNAALQVLFKGGSESAEPYKFTFYAVTTLDPPNKWEKDITMRIRER